MKQSDLIEHKRHPPITNAKKQFRHVFKEKEGMTRMNKISGSRNAARISGAQHPSTQVNSILQRNQIPKYIYKCVFFTCLNLICIKQEKKKYIVKKKNYSQLFEWVTLVPGACSQGVPGCAGATTVAAGTPKNRCRIIIFLIVINMGSAKEGLADASAPQERPKHRHCTHKK